MVQVGVGCGSGKSSSGSSRVCGGGGTNCLCVIDSKKYRFVTGEKLGSTSTYGECVAQRFRIAWGAVSCGRS